MKTLHPIQNHIMQYLETHEFARFRELIPKGANSNLVSYHMKLLQHAGKVKKTDDGYTLKSIAAYSTDANPVVQVRLLIQDGYGKVLLAKRNRQPHIHHWELPSGNMNVSDQSVVEAGRRVSRETMQFDPHKLQHVGDCYIVKKQLVQVEAGKSANGVLKDGVTIHLTIHDEERVVARDFMHIVRFGTDVITATDRLQWVEPLDLSKITLAPAVEQIINRAFFGDEFFFEEFTAET